MHQLLNLGLEFDESCKTFPQIRKRKENIRSHNHRIDPPVFGLISSMLEDLYKQGLVLERSSQINANMCTNYVNKEFQMQNLCTSR